MWNTKKSKQQITDILMTEKLRRINILPLLILSTSLHIENSSYCKCSLELAFVENFGNNEIETINTSQ